MASRYRDLPKFVWARRLFSGSYDYENGFELQGCILPELYKFKNIPDKAVTSPNIRLDNLRRFKNLQKRMNLKLRN